MNISIRNLMHYFYEHHLSLYKFIEVLQNIQVDIYIKIGSKEGGVEQKNKRTMQKYKFINEQRQIKKKMDEF
jgi:soluble P-type ATPase